MLSSHYLHFLLAVICSSSLSHAQQQLDPAAIRADPRFQPNLPPARTIRPFRFPPSVTDRPMRFRPANVAANQRTVAPAVPLTNAPPTTTPPSPPPTTTSGPAPTTPPLPPPTTTSAPLPPHIPTAASVTSLEQELSLMFQRNVSLIPKFIELSFHDCVGGCDGCLDLTNPDNAGTRDAFPLAVQLHLPHQDVISLADFISLLGREAVKEGVRQSPCDGLPCTIDLGPPVFGRQSCTDPNNPPLRNFLPGDSLNSIQFLSDTFSLTEVEAIALLGAHSVGRASPSNSGFNGVWDASEFSLDSGYYLAMSRVTNWRIQPAKDGLSTQWNGGPVPFMMMHSDMILFKNFTLDANKVPSCAFLQCPDTRNAITISQFANDVRTFHTVFAVAYNKMITTTGSPLVSLSPVTP